MNNKIIHTDCPNNIGVPNTSANAMQNYTQQFQYDELGNIMQMKSAGKWTKDYFYNINNNYLKGHTNNSIEYSYDVHGNMLSMPHLSTMVWDYKDELKAVDLDGGGTAYYVYNATGERVRKVIEKGNIVEERYYLSDYELYRKTTNGSLNIERESLFIKDDTKTIAQIDSNGTTETIRYQYDNHLGSASLELDHNASIVSYEEYHPFGTTSYRSGRTETEVSLKRYKYVGKERDEETGLYYYGARYYAGWIGRFVSVDPLATERQWLNPYNYVQNNPINRIDPTGALDDDPPKGANPEPYEEDSDVIQNNNGSKLKENPFWEESGKDSIPGGIKLNGTERDKKTFMRQLSKVTGNKYGINEDGFMYNKSKTTNTKTTNKISGELSKLVESAMGDSETFEYDLVRNDPNTLIDSYDTGKVDVGDFSKMDRIMKAGQFAHFISERMENPDDYSIANRNTLNYNIAHDKAQEYESQVVNAMLGQPYSKVVTSDKLLESKDNNGNVTGHYFKATSTYGNTSYSFNYNATYYTHNGRQAAAQGGVMFSRFKKVR